jgi:hypothetical protein
MKKIILFFVVCLAVLHNRANANTRIGIGSLYDSASMVSYHYGLMQFLISNPIPGAEAEFALSHFKKDIYVSGRINLRSAKIQIIGRAGLNDSLILTFRELRLGSIYSLIRAKLEKILTKNPLSTAKIAEEKNYDTEVFPLKKQLLFSYSGNDAAAANFLPHLYKNTIPGVTSVVEFARRIGLNCIEDPTTWPLFRSNPIILGHFPALYYSQKPEEIFFTKSTDVPWNYADGFKKLAFPVNERPGIALSYIALADTFKQTIPAYAVKLNQSALVLLNKLNCSDYQKFQMKEHIYQNLAEISGQMGYPKSAELYSLAASAINRFLSLESVVALNNNYEKNLFATEKNIGLVEEKALEIRRARRNANAALIGAAVYTAVSAAGSTTAEGAAFNSVLSDNLMQSAISFQQESYQNTQEMSNRLQDFANDNQTLDLDQFSISDLQLIFEKAFVCKEIMRLLSHEGFRQKHLDHIKQFASNAKDKKLIQGLVSMRQKFSDESYRIVRQQLMEYEKKSYLELY